MSSNKQFKIQNGVGITGSVEVGGQLVIDSDGKVVLPAIADALASSQTVTDLQIEDAAIRDYVDDNFVSDSDLAATNARTAGISVDSDGNIELSVNIEMDQNNIRGVNDIYAARGFIDHIESNDLKVQTGTADFEGSTVNFGSATVFGSGIDNRIKSEFDNHINVSTANASEFVKWTGTDYEWTDYIQGRLATDQLEVDIGGSINARTATLDFRDTLVNFSGATINGFEASGVETDALTVDGDASVTGDLTLLGSLNLSGGINQYNVTDLDVADKTITVGHGQLEVQSGGSGIVVDGSGASMLWNQSGQTWDFNKSLDVTGNVTMATGGSIVAGGVNDLILNAGESGTPDIYLQSGSSTKVKIEGSSGNALVGRTSSLSGQSGSVSANTVLSVHGPLSSHATNAGILEYYNDETLLRSYGANAGSGKLVFKVGGGGGSTDSEAMRIDSSGNLLVGKTANNLTSDGIVLRGSGELFVTRAGDVATFNRRGGTGDIVRFASNSTTIGAIRSDADSVNIGSGNVGLLFYNAGDRIIPRNEVGTSDGVLDLGFSTDRFKDLYLSGTAYIGGAPAKVAGKESMWIPAGAMYPQTTGGCSELQQVELTVNNPEIKCLDFDPDSPEYAQFTVAFPKSWDEGTITFQAFFTVEGTHTGDVVWQMNACGSGDGDAINQSFGPNAFSPAKSHSGVSNEVNVTDESPAVTVAGASADSQTYFRLCRDASGSSDTQSGDARLLGIKVFFTTNAANDA